MTTTYTGAPAGISPYVYNQPLGEYATRIEGVTLVYDFEQILPDGGLKDLGHTAPTNAGSYVLTASFAGAADYAPSTLYSDYGHGIEPGMLFDITPAPLTISAVWASKAYDGTTDIATAEATPTATGFVNLADYATGMTESFVSPNAGRAVPTVVTGYTINDGNGGKNYVVSLDPYVGFIAPANADVLVTGYDVLYDGAVHTATVTAIGVNGENLAADFDLSATQHTQANNPNGSLDAWTFIDPAGNYNSQGDQVFDRIDRATPVLNVTDAGGIYTGAAYSATATVNGNTSLEGITPTLTYAEKNANNNYNAMTGTPTNAGSYLVYATFAGSTDWNSAGSYSPVFFNITPATANVVVTPYSVTYDGAAHTATDTVAGVNGALPSSDLTLSTTHTNAGVYTDKWAFSDPNYTSQSGTVTDTINKANAAIGVQSYNAVYNGAVHTATGVNPVSNLDLTMTEHTNTGVYTDMWVFHGGQNYQDTHGTVTDTIGKANAAINMTPYSVVYDGAWHNATGSARGVNGGALNGLTINSAHVNAGTYTDSWSFTDSTGNYNNRNGTMTDVIAKANATFVVNGYNTVYDGANHSATGAAYGVNGALIAGLNLAGTVHSNVGTYYDTWTFNNPNYNYAQGTVVSLITLPRVSVVSVSPVWTEVLVRYQKVGVGKHAVLKPVYKKVQVLQIVFSGVTAAQNIHDYALESTPLCGKAPYHPVALSQVKLVNPNVVQLTTAKPLQLHPMQVLTIKTLDSIGRTLIGKIKASFNQFGTWLN